MSVKLRTNIKFENFSLRDQLPIGKRRSILRSVGTKLATKVRKRIKASGRFWKSGQMINSIKFKLFPKVAIGTLAARGKRGDSDTHQNRGPMTNFAIASFHAAKGHDVLAITDEDEKWVRQEIETQIASLLANATRR